MSSIRDPLRQMVRDQLTSQEISQNRIGHMIQINTDGSGTALVDGQGFVVALPYPGVVMGQEVLVISDNAGGLKAVPTSPTPADAVFEIPPYFTGGFIRWGSVVPTTFGGPLAAIAFQDTGISNFYNLDFSDIPGYAPLPALTFSPDGTRVAAVFQNNTTKQAHIRVYNIGQKLTGTLIPPITPVQAYTLTATLLIDIIRPSFIPTTFTPPGSTYVQDVFITDDPNSVWWSEVQVALFTVGTGVNGQIINTLNLLQATISNPIPVVVGKPITTVFVQSNVSASTNRAMWTVGNALSPFIGYGANIAQSSQFGGIWSPDRFQFLGLVEDPQNGFGSVSGAILTGLGVNQNDPNNQTIGPAAAAIIIGSGTSFSENGWNLVLTGVTVGSGGITILKQSATGDVFNYTGNLPPNGHFSVGSAPTTPSFSKRYRASPFANVVSQTVGPSQVSFFYQDIKTGVTTEAVLLPPDNVPINSIGANCEIMLSSLSAGFVLDNHGSPGPFLRRISSSDMGLTWIADPSSKAIQVTPKQTVQPFPPIAFPSSSGIIKGVSTR